jgi:3-hydroxyacyl-CoA dehydrogenase/enoyl-CoA hydratase/3-hydroxybutyryl-CoA epimerase/enoyl-CoA isomerase
MIYSDNAISVSMHDNGIAELIFDLQGESVNKFNAATVGSLRNAIDALKSAEGVKGLLVTSAKPVFIVGADISEFVPLFKLPVEQMAAFTGENNNNMLDMEALPFPSVVAINGYAVGGGLEFCLSCDFRVMSTAAKIGLPEIKLGLMPGWGGTVRLPRIIGIDEALMWIAAAGEHRADAALKAGAVDAIAEPAALRDVALQTLQNAIDGGLDYCARRIAKSSPMPLNKVEAMMAFTTAKALVAQQAGKNMPAPLTSVTSVEKSYNLPIKEALAVEAKHFGKLAATSQAAAMVGLFLNDQLLGKKAKKWEKQNNSPINQAAVLGAGIMGGGIAYQSAFRGTPIKMKDIAQPGIDLGMSEAAKLLTKRVSRGRMSPDQMAQVLNSISPTLNYDGFDNVDVCVEAVVENPKVKHAVLAEVEGVLAENAVLASNTSTISISYLAGALKRPENFAGMHFFNPVHAMPLVEVIRGEKTSDATVATLVAYANKLGKKAIVVKDCPGFLVNRVLFPYFDGFSRLVRDGADFAAVDKVMESWGWPMGPAYLLDVVGIDTGVHAGAVMSEGFPDRMTPGFKTATEIMFENQRYGQKNKLGFYEYELDKRGKPKRSPSAVSYELLKDHVAAPRDFTESEIIARCMLPMAIEMARCLEEGIVESVAEADMSVIYGIGFPVFRGGLFQWMDSLGMDKVVAMADQYIDLGKAYEVTQTMRDMAKNNQRYYG